MGERLTAQPFRRSGGAAGGLRAQPGLRSGGVAALRRCCSDAPHDRRRVHAVPRSGGVAARRWGCGGQTTEVVGEWALRRVAREAAELPSGAAAMHGRGSRAWSGGLGIGMVIFFFRNWEPGCR
ncbi:unnamed protein product [Miscanthus lutarioriparius]|uniref:Uncharacterized protein n=1 Tax=Miscanthus lutarioriparius TaxID=422564 RepID=A0A811RD49_9POAL|nr:unnamed protein product [Miscanthus lutarioriparius]